MTALFYVKGSWSSLASALLLVACGGTSDPAATAPNGDAALACMTTIVVRTCGLDGCHSGVNLSANLMITADTIKDGKNFINRAAQGGDGTIECATPGNVLINPTAPEQSLIYKKLAPDVCGSQMPETEPKLTDTEKACVL